MDENNRQKFIKIFDVLDKIEDEAIEAKESLEKQLNPIRKRIDRYEMKISLSDRQEEILDELESQADELEEEIEKVEEFIEHISEAIDLIDCDLSQCIRRTEKIKKQTEKMLLELEINKRKNEKTN